MIHVRHIDQFPEANNPVPFKIDTFELFQEILCPVHALVTATRFRYTNAIVRIIRIIDLNQTFVAAGTKLSESEGESPLLTHIAAWLVGGMSSFADFSLKRGRLAREQDLVKIRLANGWYV